MRESPATPTGLTASAVVDDEFNSVINPAHPEMADVSIEDITPYAFDERLLRRFKREA